ncbi:MAG: hypothetical protein ACI4SK_03995 [Christensenellales bacterium]
MNNLFMLLPFLMGMKNGGNSNLADMMSALGGQNASQDKNPMLSLIMNMMNKSDKPSPQDAPVKDKLEAIKNLSGQEVTEALRILLNNR